MQLVSQICCVVVRQVAREIARCNITIINSRNIFVLQALHEVESASTFHNDYGNAAKHF